MQNKIKQLVQDSIDAKTHMLAPEQLAVVEQITQAVVAAYRSCKKVLVFGNGGSAADAQHFAAELVVRFAKNRMALPAIALTTDTSILTAAGNDLSFDDIFSRQVEAFCQPGDVAIGISTSGNSPNVLKAMAKAKELNGVTVAFTGGTGGKLKGSADICFCAPATVTARMQECHELAIHIICLLVEEKLFA